MRFVQPVPIENQIVGTIKGDVKLQNGCYKKEETYSKEEIDSIVLGMTETSTDDIDAMFGDNTVDLSNAPIVSTDEIDEMFE